MAPRKKLPRETEKKTASRKKKVKEFAPEIYEVEEVLPEGELSHNRCAPCHCPIEE